MKVCPLQVLVLFLAKFAKIAVVVLFCLGNDLKCRTICWLFLKNNTLFFWNFSYLLTFYFMKFQTTCDFKIKPFTGFSKRIRFAFEIFLPLKSLCFSISWTQLYASLRNETKKVKIFKILNIGIVLFQKKSIFQIHHFWTFFHQNFRKWSLGK